MSHEIVSAAIPLLDLDSSTDELHLWQGTKILKMNYQQLSSKYYTKEAVYFSNLKLPGMKFALEIENIFDFLTAELFDLPKHKEIDDASYCRISTSMFNEMLVKTLRLYKRGAVNAPFIFYKAGSALPFPVLESSGFMEILGETYFLDESETEEILILFNKVRNPNFASTGYVKKAIHRFFTSYLERTLEDKIIDYFMSFESLFCRGEGSERASKGEVISVGASMLIGADNMDREGIRNYLRQGYNLRNNIIHSSLSISEWLKRKGIREDEKSFTYRIEDYLRGCIKKLS